METIEPPFGSDTRAVVQAPKPPLTPIQVQASDLPLSCPRPGDELWSMHPRVYLPIDETPDRRAVCPYCGAVYELEGEVSKAH